MSLQETKLKIYLFSLIIIELGQICVRESKISEYKRSKSKVNVVCENELPVLVTFVTLTDFLIFSECNYIKLASPRSACY